MADDFKLPTKIIVDASLVLCFLFPDEKLVPKAKELLLGFSKGNIEFLAPPLLEIEVLNGLKSAILAKRISEKEARILEEKFFEMEITEIPFKRQRIFEISLRYKISVYDAVYLTCAKAEKMPLYTCDQKFFEKVKKDFQIVLVS